MRQKIYFDLDGIFRDLMHGFRQQYGAVEEFYQPEVLKYISDQPDADWIKNAPAIGMQWLLSFIRGHGDLYDIYLLTSQPDNWIAPTIEFLEDHDLRGLFKEIIIVNGHERKYHAISARGGNAYLIDDRLDTLANLPCNCKGVWIHNNYTKDFDRYTDGDYDRIIATFEKVEDITDDEIKTLF